jgi:type II secretory pathway pseudopilin PulG
MTLKKASGFSLLEMAIAVTIIFILAALTVPTLMTQVNAIRIQYSATDLSGLLQRVRMEAVRKNTFYSVQQAGGNPVLEQVVDKTGAVVTSIPPAPMGNSVNVFYGTGSGAPGEAAFVTSLNFAASPATAGLPSFSARGLPCVPVGNTLCPMVPGTGFVFFVSGTSGSSGSQGWASVVVTPSGRVQVWSYSGTSWAQL